MGNKLVNTTSVKLGIYETSTDSQLAGMLGDKKEWEDGRVFRLCKNGGSDLVAGILVQSIVSLASDDSLEIAVTQEAGDYEVVVTADSSSEHAVNTLRDGYLVFSDTTGDIGTFYKIKDNEALEDGEDCKITLYDKLTTAITLGTNECTICVNPYSGVIIDANTAPLVGVPLIAVPADRYFWALCEGVGPATATATTIAAGDYLKHTAGDVLTWTIVDTSTTGDATITTYTEAPIGVALTAAAASDALIVKYFAMG